MRLGRRCGQGFCIPGPGFKIPVPGFSVRRIDFSKRRVPVPGFRVRRTESATCRVTPSTSPATGTCAKAESPPRAREDRPLPGHPRASAWIPPCESRIPVPGFAVSKTPFCERRIPGPGFRVRSSETATCRGRARELRGRDVRIGIAPWILCASLIGALQGDPLSDTDRKALRDMRLGRRCVQGF